MSRKKNKTSVSDGNVTKLIFLLIITIPMVVFGIYSKKSKNKKLDSCSKIIKAEIYKKEVSSKTRHNYYKFEVNNKVYENGFVSSWDLKVGDIIYIRYYCKDPKVSKEVKVDGKNYLLEKDSLLLHSNLED